MNADEYQKLKELFQSVLEVPDDERESFLDAACTDNSDLRREVERLLESRDSEFLETPAVEEFAEGISLRSSRSGQRIGHYNVLKKIGSGGMGDVYLAVDGKLGRRVAIKILPEEFTSDQDRLNRFRLEARSASSLSHPNILTIHEIGEWEGTHYIATEYVEGETLRQRLGRKSLSVGESIELGVQLVAAIAAAHEAGICHRDIKPENIMIRQDGLVKVVDFGLAKLTRSPFAAEISPASHDESTVRIVKTEPGVIMGTVQYMSPEQTRGHTTDERSDIWGLGCVLYEMLAGKPPFSGENSADVIADIVKTHPTPLSNLDAEIPERLDEVVSKALEKNPDERYQTAKDLSIDLKRMKRRFDVDDILERSSPNFSNNSDDRIASTPNIISTRKGQKDLTTVNSAEYLYWGIKAHRWTTIGIALFVLTLLGGTAYLVRIYWRGPNEARMAYANKIKLAARALDASNLTSAKQLLDETRPGTGEEDLRGFEWGYLSRLHAERMASQPLPLPHKAWVEGVAFSPNGAVLATAGGDNIVRLWDVTTGQQIKELVGHTALVWSVVFSPDGKTLLSGGEDKTMKLWDVAPGQELFTVGGEQEPVSTPVFSPDGKTIATANNGDIKLWDAVSGKEKRGGFKTTGGDMLFGFSPDGKYLSVKGPNFDAIIWEIAASRSAAVLARHNGFLTDVKFSPDSRSVLTGNTDGTAKLWDLKTGRDLRTFRGHTDGIYDVAFSPNGKVIATGSHDKTIRFWDADKGHEITALKGHLSIVTALAISPDGRKVASGSQDNTARIWNVPKETRGVLRDHTSGIRSLAFSNDGKTLASSSGDKTAKIWDVETEQDRLTLTGHTDVVNSTAFSPDGQTLATGSNDRMVKLWDIVTGKKRLSFDSQASGTVAVFSPDGKLIATNHFFNGPTVRLWDAATGTLRCSFLVGDDETESSVFLEFSKDGRQVTALRGDSSVRLWDAASCSETWSFKGEPGAQYFATFRPKGKLTVIQVLNGISLKLIDAESRTEIVSILGHDKEIGAVEFTSDGNRLVTSGSDSLVKVWDLATGQELLSITTNIGGIEALAISRDGSTLAVGGSDGTIRLLRTADN